METGDSGLLFIDVDASTASVKQQHQAPEDTHRAKRVRATPELRFKCNTCSYVTYHRALFREHKNRHEGIKPYKCELCPYSSVSKKYTKQHQARHRACACGHVARNNKHMRRHLAACGAPRPDVAREWPDVAHTCPRCRREYVDEKALAAHSGRCPAVPVSGARDDVSGRADTAPFECAACGWRWRGGAGRGGGGGARRVLLHLIHHPQVPQRADIDTSVLRRCGILA